MEQKCPKYNKLGFQQGHATSVTAVTEEPPDLGETANVNMVRRASTKVLFEPGDTRQQWKGEAAARLVIRDRQ